MTGPRARVALCLLVLTLLPACAERETPVPSPLIVSVLPGQAPEALQAQYAGLLTHLERSTGLDLELQLFPDYEAFLAAFERDLVHVAWFGGLTFVRADAGGGAEPLAMRDVDRRFTSVYLARADTPGSDVAAFRGQRFAFGSRLSTSGHLMPRFYLQEQGIEPETYFSEVRYSGAHDATAMMVRDGGADLGVANALIVDDLFESGRLSADDVRIVTFTPPYPDHVWATQPELPLRVRRALLGALLALNRARPDHAAILRAQGARGYLPATRDDFEPVRRAALRLELLAPAP